MYITPATFATDAAAPCFKPDERFYTCPRGLAANANMATVGKWDGLASQGVLTLLGAPENLNAHVLQAIQCVNEARNARDSYRIAKETNT